MKMDWVGYANKIKDLLPEFAERSQWVSYKLGEKVKPNGKRDKFPKYTKDKKLLDAKSNDPSTWMSIDEAIYCSSKFNLTGIGFEFSVDDPFVGIDLDLCRNSEGQIEEWAWEIIKEFSCFTEISVSKMGLHIFCQSQIQPTIAKAKKQPKLEAYSQGRFIAITVDLLGEQYLGIEERTNQIEKLVKEYQPPVEQTSPYSFKPNRPSSKYSNSVSDEQKAAEALARLSSWRLENYDPWVEVGMSLRELGTIGLMLWDNWSRGSSFYDRREMEQKWHNSSFHGSSGKGKITLASLFFWADEDDPAGKERRKQNTYNFKQPTYKENSKENHQEASSDTPPGSPEEAKTDSPDNDPLALTDMGNAQRLVRLYGENIKYCFVWKKWLVWDDKKWTSDDLGIVAQLAERTAKSIFQEAASAQSLEDSTALAKWGIKSQDNQRIKALLERARNQETIPVLPEQFDSDPWLLNCLNGTIDLKTGKLHYHKKTDLLTKSTTTEYIPNATCPIWLSFLNRIMEGNQNLVGFLRRAIGYSLTGNTMEKSLFFLYGAKGDNGKSTFLETITHLMGSYALAKFPVAALIDDPKANSNASANVAQLAGVRFVSCSEIGKGKKLNEELVKDLTGGIDTISAKRLYENPFTFRPTHKLFIYGNDKPLASATDNAIWKRIKLIPFVVSIPEAEQDKQLPEKLLSELPGILAWAVEGCLEWQKSGIGVPDEVKDAVNNYRSEMDALGGFLEDCCLTETDSKCSAKSLMEAYEKWCEQNGEKVYSQKFFGGQLTAKGFERYKGAGGYYWWKGIGLLSESTS